MTGLAILVFCVLPTDDVARDRVDVIEKNFVYSDCGNRTFQQFIWWQGDDVVAWRLVKDGQHVERDWDRGGWVLRFTDGKQFREVRATSYTERHSQYDREYFERDKLPQCLRRGLSFERTTNHE